MSEVVPSNDILWSDFILIHVVYILIVYILVVYVIRSSKLYYPVEPLISAILQMQSTARDT